jgi:hypothetical protein
MKKATHALGALLCFFSFSCGFDEVETLHQDLPEFYALDFSPGCFVPMKSGSDALRDATRMIFFYNMKFNFRTLEELSHIIADNWHDEAWEYSMQDNWQSRDDLFPGNHGVASEEDDEHGSNAIALSGGQSVSNSWSRDMRAERLYDEDTDGFYLSLTEAGMYCAWREAGDAQSVCQEYDVQAAIHFEDNAMRIENYWGEGHHIRWTKHALALENTNNDTTSIVGCDPETSVSFMKAVWPHYTCWDAGGDETSCRGVNLWPTD